MKDEDLDWQVYHLVIDGPGISFSELASRTGIEEDAIRSSACRLVSGLLVEIRGDMVHALSIQEALLRCQCKYDKSLPYTIENGIVIMKKEQE